MVAGSLITARWWRRSSTGIGPGSRGRNVVELSFVRLKQWRALATRYDKLATVYRTAAVLAAVITWLHH